MLPSGWSFKISMGSTRGRACVCVVLCLSLPVGNPFRVGMSRPSLPGSNSRRLARRCCARLGEGAQPIPRHVAIIPDGNGRWAVARGLPRSAGHAAGAEAALRAVMHLFESGVQIVSLFALSTENLPPRRTASEVGFILELVAQYLSQQADNLAERDICVRVVYSSGCVPYLPAQLRTAITELGLRAKQRQAEASQSSAQPERASELLAVGVNAQGAAEARRRLETDPDGCAPRAAKRTLCIALAYGGRSDLAHAARELATKVSAGLLSAEAIDEEALAAHLATGHESRLCLSSEPELAALPDVDLLIRSSGEHRLSNFLMWQSAYAELHFTPALWPDCGRAELDAALRQFADTDRRFGRASSPSAAGG